MILVCKNLHAYREAENERHLLVQFHFSGVHFETKLQHLKTCSLSLKLMTVSSCFLSLQYIVCTF